MMEGVKDNLVSSPNFRPANQSRVLFRIRFYQVILLLLSLGSLGLGFKYFRVQNLAPAMATTRLASCSKETNETLESFIKPPFSLWHNMKDSELLRRASFEPRISNYPFKRVPKIAFMFLTKGPLPLAPLWEKFFNGNEKLFSIYVHNSPNYVPDFLISSVFYNRQIPSQMVAWGTMSMCDAERRLLANALLDISNEWFVLLSESCIPLRNFGVIYHYISKSRFSFMGSVDDHGPTARGRYRKGMQPEIKRKQWRKGSQWFEINRKLAVDIVRDKTYYPKFKDFCKPPCYVDEHYFPTMLTIQSPHLLANRTLTWMDWSRGGFHPATLGKSDITVEFFKRVLEAQSCTYNNNKISKICYLFARKFAPNSLEPLLEIASEALGF